MRHLLRPFQFFRAERGRIALTATLLVFSIGLSLLKPWPVAFLVDVVLGDRPTPPWLGEQLGQVEKSLLIPVAAGMALVIHLLQAAVGAGQNFLVIGIGLRGLRRVREAAFTALQRLSLRMVRSARAGDLLQRAAWDTFWFQSWFNQGVVTAASAALTLGLMLVIMTRLNRPLTLVAAVLALLLAIVIRFFNRRLTDHARTAQEADSHLTSLIQQGVTTLPLIQSFTREDLQLAGFRSGADAARRRRLRQHRWELLYWFTIGSLFAVGTAVTLALGANQVQAHRLTIGELLLFLAYLAQFYEPLNQLSHVGSTLATARGATDRVFELLEQPHEVAEAPNARPVVRAGTVPAPAGRALPLRGAIDFDGVTFGYERERPVLQGIDVKIPAGAMVAILGPSGAGKTTLLNLVPRFHDPDTGTVRLDGVDLKELRLRDLRSHIAVVWQESLLLPATVAENIAYGRPGAGPAAIEAAARSAHAHEFIARLPAGYDTLLGDGAAQLSVGQRQRLGLARAFLKDAPILLLDEPTSALDAESEAAVVSALNRLATGRTTLVVAHRPATIQRADHVLVLVDGRVAEWGTPAELMNRGGYFARMTAPAG